MGWASQSLNAVSLGFVSFCPTAPGPVLDIGAAYGTASIAALQAGATVIANDLEAAHLEHLRGQPNLTLKPGRFPRHLHFEPETLGAVHASSVFHFLTGNQLEEGFRAIARWLRPGGKLFVQAATPFQTPFVAFIPDYNRRMEAKEKWPGWVEKISAYSTHRQLGMMPSSIHLLDDQVLRRLAESVGLHVEQAWLYRRDDLPASLHLDGRESAGLVASKPHRP